MNCLYTIPLCNFGFAFRHATCVIVKDFGKALLKTKSSPIFFSYKLISERKPLFEIAHCVQVNQIWRGLLLFCICIALSHLLLFSGHFVTSEHDIRWICNHPGDNLYYYPHFLSKFCNPTFFMASLKNKQKQTNKQTKQKNKTKQNKTKTNKQNCLNHRFWPKTPTTD